MFAFVGVPSPTKSIKRNDRPSSVFSPAGFMGRMPFPSPQSLYSKPKSVAGLCGFSSTNCQPSSILVEQ